MTLYMGNGEGEGEGVTVPSWRQAGLWSKCPLLPAESLHPNNGAHSPPNRAGPSTQMLMVRGQEGTGGVLPVLRPQCALHRLPASLAVGRGPQGCQGTHLPMASRNIKLSTYSAAHPSQNNSSCLQREGAEIIKGSRQRGGMGRGTPPSSSLSPSPPPTPGPRSPPALSIISECHFNH